MINFQDIYLSPTKYCDCGNGQLKDQVMEIIQDARTIKDKALKIFFYVRDNIKFNSTLNIFKKASKTLKGGTIDYCNKINLHIALLRAANIPARIHYALIDKDILRYFVPSFLFKHIPNPIGHPWCECYLNHQWISCEALFDQALFKGLYEKGIISSTEISTINWDGKTNLILFKYWIIKDHKIFTSFDDLLTEELKEVGYPPRLFCILIDWLARLGSCRITNKIRNFSQ